MGLDKEQDKLIEQLYREMYIQLYAYAINALTDRQLAEEAVQDTFRIACMKADSLLKSDNKKGWLTNTLKHVIQNIRRSRARLNSLVISALSIDDIVIVSPTGGLDFDVIYSDLLGQEDFELLQMIILNKYTILKVARELGISVEACKKRVQRAKKKLRKIIERNS
jgi:RNA polymerase sigma-70 factor (ECF subfamily)